MAETSEQQKRPMPLLSPLTLEVMLEKAMREPTLVDALSTLAILETERVVRQVSHNYGSGTNGAGWDTCYKLIFSEFITMYNREPKDITLMVAL